jgi:hypothetical protein
MKGAVGGRRALQQELQRVGCNTDALDGNWSDASQRALERFSQYAAVKIDVPRKLSVLSYPRRRKAAFSVLSLISLAPRGAGHILRAHRR